MVLLLLFSNDIPVFSPWTLMVLDNRFCQCAAELVYKLRSLYISSGAYMQAPQRLAAGYCKTPCTGLVPKVNDSWWHCGMAKHWHLHIFSGNRPKNNIKNIGFLGFLRAAGDFFSRIEGKKIAEKVDFCKVL